MLIATLCCSQPLLVPASRMHGATDHPSFHKFSTNSICHRFVHTRPRHLPAWLAGSCQRFLHQMRVSDPTFPLQNNKKNEYGSLESEPTRKTFYFANKKKPNQIVHAANQTRLRPASHVRRRSSSCTTQILVIGCIICSIKNLSTTVKSVHKYSISHLNSWYEKEDFHNMLLSTPACCSKPHVRCNRPEVIPKHVHTYRPLLFCTHTSKTPSCMACKHVSTISSLDFDCKMMEKLDTFHKDDGKKYKSERNKTNRFISP
jgi:hypothetical protein